MIIDKLLSNQSIIVSLDVDGALFERIEQIKEVGFNIIEINSSDSQLLSQIMLKYPSLKIGAGGIINTEQLENCYQAGVHFVSSPGFLPAIAQTAIVYSINYLPGVATVSEAMAAINIGYQQVRPLPAQLAFCEVLNKYLPTLQLFPADIEWDTAELFLNLPSVAAVSISNPDKKQLSALLATSIA